MNDAQSKPLHGRVALVTGSVRNIGKSIALALAAQGAHVVVNSRTRSADGDAVVGEIERMGSKALYRVADITDEGDVEAMVSEAVDTFGRIDVLVNNAAVRRHYPFEELSLAEWRAVNAVILEGAFLCSRAVVRRMGPQGGRIINIGGVSAHRGAPERAHVIAAKAGLVGLTKALAIELAGRGITANCVAPGDIDTARDANAGARPHAADSLPPVGRQGLPEDIAGAVAFLASPASGYVTGQTLHVSGGLYLP